MGAVLWELMAFIASIIAPGCSRVEILSVGEPPELANQTGTLPPSSLAVSHLFKSKRKKQREQFSRDD
jgi:hypothetical protein